MLDDNCKFVLKNNLPLYIKNEIKDFAECDSEVYCDLDFVYKSDLKERG